MNSLVCNYAVARFMPYRESGEFVNIGVVAVFPRLGLLLYHFESRRYGRITNFFPELNVNVYLDAQRAVQAEVQRLGASLFELFEKPGYGQEQIELSKAVFNDITRVRESMIYFGDPGVMLCNTPENALEDLYHTYIKRQFARKPEYQEQIMQERVRCLLREWNIARYYKQDHRVGNEDYSVKIPFVYYHGDQPVTAIRPLNLDKSKSFEIYDHGDKLIAAVKRLRGLNKLPERLIIPVNKPAESAAKRLKAAKAIEVELGTAGAIVIPFEEERLHHEAFLHLTATAG